MIGIIGDVIRLVLMTPIILLYVQKKLVTFSDDQILVSKFE